jgi:endoglucanase
VVCTSNIKREEAPEGFTIRTGVNISHWLSQSKKRGEERKNYITKVDFDTIASVGFDHVRIPIDEEQMWDEDGNKEREAFGLLHNAINWALTANLRVIVDLHLIRSHHFLAETNPLWVKPAEQEKLVDLWLQLSEELKVYPNNMVAYEILNEVVADDPEDWNNLIEKVIREIRMKEPERKIVVGSNRWQIPSTFPDLKTPKDDANIVLSFHFYSPMGLTHHKAPWHTVGEYTGKVNYPGQIIDTLHYKELSEKTVKAMREHANGYFTKDTLERIMSPAIEVAKSKKIPLYCGEFGVYPTISEEIALRWYKDVCDIFNSNNIAYSHWCYKGDFPIVDENRVPNRRLISVLTDK